MFGTDATVDEDDGGTLESGGMSEDDAPLLDDYALCCVPYLGRIHHVLCAFPVIRCCYFRATVEAPRRHHCK